MEKFIAGWFVIYTKPRHEKKISNQLANLNVTHLLPLVKKLRTWSDRKKYLDEPLFPSYVFVKLEDSHSYFYTLEIGGVLHYVKSGKQIARVNETIIDNLRLVTTHSPANLEVSSAHIYPGKRLCISEGPFTGLNCEAIDYKGKQKILVRIELLQRSLLLDVPICQLMSAENVMSATAV